jgi:O-acetylserine/cysteine efflux transporter
MGFDPQVFHHWPSLALVVASALAGSFGLMGIKKLSGFAPLELQAWMAVSGLPLLVALSLWLEGSPLATLSSISWRAWAALGYTILLSSLLAHTIFYHLVQRYPVTSVAPVTTLSPVFSVLLAILILDDVLSTRIAFGGLMTLAGVLIITLRERRIVDTGS